MKVVLDEKQLRLYKNFLLENSEIEGRGLTAGQKKIIKPHVDKVAKEVFGDRYGKRDDRASERYQAISEICSHES